MLLLHQQNTSRHRREVPGGRTVQCLPEAPCNPRQLYPSTGPKCKPGMCDHVWKTRMACFWRLFESAICVPNWQPLFGTVLAGAILGQNFVLHTLQACYLVNSWWLPHLTGPSFDDDGCETRLPASSRTFPIRSTALPGLTLKADAPTGPTAFKNTNAHQLSLESLQDALERQRFRTKGISILECRDCVGWPAFASIVRNTGCSRGQTWGRDGRVICLAKRCCHICSGLACKALSIDVAEGVR